MLVCAITDKTAAQIAPVSDSLDSIEPAPTPSSELPESTALTPDEAMVEQAHIVNPADPLDFGRHRCHDTSLARLRSVHPNGKPRRIRKFYTQQNRLIDQFLGADDEERLKIEEDVRMGPRIRFAVNASFVVNLSLFIIQLYAAISTGSLAV